MSIAVKVVTSSSTIIHGLVNRREEPATVLKGARAICAAGNGPDRDIEAEFPLEAVAVSKRWARAANTDSTITHAHTAAASARCNPRSASGTFNNTTPPPTVACTMKKLKANPEANHTA